MQSPGAAIVWKSPWPSEAKFENVDLPSSLPYGVQVGLVSAPGLPSKSETEVTASTSG